MLVCHLGKPASLMIMSFSLHIFTYMLRRHYITALAHCFRVILRYCTTYTTYCLSHVVYYFVADVVLPATYAHWSLYTYFISHIVYMAYYYVILAR